MILILVQFAFREIYLYLYPNKLQSDGEVGSFHTWVK